VADYQGRPHLYQSLYLDEGTPWEESVEDHFALLPVAEEEVSALLARLREFWPDPASPMFFPVGARQP
jgi:hypothetical protein